MRFGRRALAALSLLTIAGASLGCSKRETPSGGGSPGARRSWPPRDETALARHSGEFPKIELFTIDEVFGGWDKAQKTHFEDKGVFDQIYTPK